MHFVCIFNKYIFNINTLYLLQDCQMELIFIKENREFTDIDSNIDSNENINLLPNDKNFETLYLPK